MAKRCIFLEGFGKVRSRFRYKYAALPTQEMQILR